MYLKEAIGGALAGLVIVALAAGGYFTYQALDSQPPPVQAQKLEYEKPIYVSARELFEHLHPLCRNFSPVRTLGSERDAATCSLDGQEARIGVYETASDTQDAVDGSGGRGAYGNRLTVVAGVNWVMSFPWREGSSALAEKVAAELKGAVVFR